MSDGYLTTPPPPPPPPQAPRQPAFDFVKPLAFVFEDPRWVSKVLLGGLFQLASVIIIGIPFVLGYLARLARNVANDVALPLPEWDDLGDYFAEGLRLIGVGIVYVIPFFVIFGLFMIPVLAISGAMHMSHDFDPHDAEGLISCVYCLVFPLSLAYMVWMPAALLFAAMEERFGAAFEFARIWNFIKNNIGNYLLAVVVTIVARVAASFGLILFCVGVLFTLFWAMLVAVHAFAQTWRLAAVR
jgi:hypothetical protein